MLAILLLNWWVDFETGRKNWKSVNKQALFRTKIVKNEKTRVQYVQDSPRFHSYKDQNYFQLQRGRIFCWPSCAALTMFDFFFVVSFFLAGVGENSLPFGFPCLNALWSLHCITIVKTPYQKSSRSLRNDYSDDNWPKRHNNVYSIDWLIEEGKIIILEVR